MIDIRTLRNFSPDELVTVETLEEICAKYDELHAEYTTAPTDKLLEISHKIDEMRWSTARELGLSALRTDFSQPTQHKFVPLRSLLAQIA